MLFGHHLEINVIYVKFKIVSQPEVKFQVNKMNPEIMKSTKNKLSDKLLS